MTLKWEKSELNKLSQAQASVAAAEAELNGAFFERRAVVRSLLIAHLIREHVLLLGPPGTGKSMLTRTFADVFAGGSYFEILMTKFTVPEEIFGPIAFSQLKQDKYERKIDGFAPTKRMWFLDEIWKASSAILNTMLKATNERTMRNGDHEIDLPLETLIGASNEYPGDDSLQALYDRFMFKHWVEQVSDRDNLRALWGNGGRPSAVNARVSVDDVKILRRAICEMEFSNGQMDTLATIEEAVSGEGFLPSTRTWMKALKVVKGAAVASGRTTVAGGDFKILADVLWKEHKDRPKLRDVVGNAADPYGARAEAIVDGVKTAMQALPTIDMVASGQKTKAEVIKVIAEVGGQVATERDKIAAVIEKAGTGDPSIMEAQDAVDAAQRQVDKLMKDVTWHRGGK